MARSIRLAGALMAVVGLLVAAAPFISVGRVGTQMLTELPEIDGSSSTDERVGWSAMFDDDFVVARRTYSDVSEQVVVVALRNDGFDVGGVNGISRECCGDYDGVWVTISTPAPGTVTAELRPVDTDWQSWWPFVAMIGLALSTVGIVLASRSRPGDPLVLPKQSHRASVRA